MDGKLSNKVILLVGGGGIGNEVARAYAREGASVVLGDMDEKNAQEVAGEIVAAGGKALGLHVDGSAVDSVRSAVDQAQAQFGGLDGLHANFASFADGRLDVSALDLPLEVYDEMMFVNARGFLICTQQALPAILARGGGSIVYTSSGAAHEPAPTRSAYAMSKAAGHALMRHIALCFGPQGVRANTIAPGVMMHPKLAAAVPPGFETWALSRTPIKSRLGRPSDIAALAVLLMSDDGGYITGQVLSVDGGATMRG